MITTTWKCDKCGHEQNTSEQMWDIVVQFQHTGIARSSFTYAPANALWCRKCCEEFPSLLGEKVDKSLPAYQDSLTDLIRELIREVVQEEMSHD